MSGVLDALRRPGLVRIARLAIGAVFAAAALAKIGDIGTFAGQVHNFHIVPVALENLVAMSMPWIELVAALALITGIRDRAAALVTLGLMLVFTLAVVLALARGLDIECGCFGTADASTVGAFKLIENVGLTLLAGVASLAPRR